MEKRAPHGAGFVLAFMISLFFVSSLLLGVFLKHTKTEPKPRRDWSEQRTECARQNGHLWPDSFSAVWCIETATGKRLYKPRRKPRKSKIW